MPRNGNWYLRRHSCVLASCWRNGPADDDRNVGGLGRVRPGWSSTNCRWPPGRGRRCAKRPFYIGLLWALGSARVPQTCALSQVCLPVFYIIPVTRGNKERRRPMKEFEFDVCETWLWWAITYQKLPSAVRDHGILVCSCAYNFVQLASWTVQPFICIYHI